MDTVSAGFAENVITGLLGRNGAGRITMMQLLAGHLVPTSGRIEVFGAKPYDNESVLAQLWLVKENQKYRSISGSSTRCRRPRCYFRIGMQRTRIRCSTTSIFPRSGGSRSSPGACWRDRSRRDVLVVHPRDDPSNPQRGVFSTRFPDGPNPIGLHQVRILSIEDNRVCVRDFEALNGTPIVDVKPVLEPRGRR